MASARLPNSQGSSQSKPWQKQVLCRFFVNGMCRAEENCPYGHDMMLSNKGTIACKFFATGTCAHGDKCRFSHGDPVLTPPTQATHNATTTNSMTKTVTSSLNKMTLNPSASSWTPNQFLAKGSSSSTSRPGFETSRPEFESSMPGFETSRTGFESWVNASEFVPQSSKPKLRPLTKTNSDVERNTEGAATSGDSEPKSWAQVVNSEVMAEVTIEEAESQLCPFSLMEECRYGENCAYVHGLICDMCNQPILHPSHEAQRRSHQKSCMKQYEVEMEQAFAVAKSRERTCGICMEIVMEKMPKTEARFGIMPNCNHCFCLSCLRKWRQAKQFENKIIRACPECRQTSDYICPSKYWMDTSEEKEKLFDDYRANLLKKECKYFDKGQGECPFGNKCFYRHANKEGKDVDVGPPQKNVRHNANGDPSLVERILLYDFLEERDGQLLLPLEIFDVLDFLSDSDDSEWSDQQNTIFR